MGKLQEAVHYLVLAGTSVYMYATCAKDSKSATFVAIGLLVVGINGYTHGYFIKMSKIQRTVHYLILLTAVYMYGTCTKDAKSATVAALGVVVLAINSFMLGRLTNKQTESNEEELQCKKTLRN